MKALTLAVLFFASLSIQQSESIQKETASANRAVGSFEVKVAPLSPYNQEDKTLGRFSIEKEFHGDLEASSKGEMLSAGNPSASGGYVAIEKVTGKLKGRSGTFVLQHSATIEKGQMHISVFVVPGSGSGELSGISGSMEIIFDAGRHSYVFNYQL